MILIIKTIFSVLQFILMLCIYFSCKNRNDKKISNAVIVYLSMLTVVLWL